MHGKSANYLPNAIISWENNWKEGLISFEIRPFTLDAFFLLGVVFRPFASSATGAVMCNLRSQPMVFLAFFGLRTSVSLESSYCWPMVFLALTLRAHCREPCFPPQPLLYIVN